MKRAIQIIILIMAIILSGCGLLQGNESKQPAITVPPERAGTAETQIPTQKPEGEVNATGATEEQETAPLDPSVTDTVPDNTESTPIDTSYPTTEPDSNDNPWITEEIIRTPNTPATTPDDTADSTQETSSADDDSAVEETTGDNSSEEDSWELEEL